jgi:hypothetical protein
MKLNFFNKFSKNTEISNLMKIRPGGSVLFNVDRWPDITKLIDDFRNFVNAPKKVVLPFWRNLLPSISCT